MSANGNRNSQTGNRTHHVHFTYVNHFTLFQQLWRQLVRILGFSSICDVIRFDFDVEVVLHVPESENSIGNP